MYPDISPEIMMLAIWLHYCQRIHISRSKAEKIQIVSLSMMKTQPHYFLVMRSQAYILKPSLLSKVLVSIIVIHYLFAEPTHSPCMLQGVHTGLHDGISVQEIGIDNITAADGLAVGRAIEPIIDGYYTIDDSEMYNLLALFNQTESIKLEPSAVAWSHQMKCRNIYLKPNWIKVIR